MGSRQGKSCQSFGKGAAKEYSIKKNSIWTSSLCRLSETVKTWFGQMANHQVSAIVRWTCGCMVFLLLVLHHTHSTASTGDPRQTKQNNGKTRGLNSVDYRTCEVTSYYYHLTEPSRTDDRSNWRPIKNLVPFFGLQYLQHYTFYPQAHQSPPRIYYSVSSIGSSSSLTTISSSSSSSTVNSTC